MKILPNGLKVFNATPHSITFWSEDWDEPVEVESDVIVSAKPQEDVVFIVKAAPDGPPGITFVKTRFVGTDAGAEIVRQAYRDGADLVVGSIVAAQAYPGLVVAMTPAPGYERVGFVDPLLKDALSALKHLPVDADAAPSLEKLIEKLETKVNQPSKRMNPNKFTISENAEFKYTKAQGA